MNFRFSRGDRDTGDDYRRPLAEWVRWNPILGVSVVKSPWHACSCLDDSIYGQIGLDSQDSTNIRKCQVLDPGPVGLAPKQVLEVDSDR